MKILITGCRGQLGTELQRQLAEELGMYKTTYARYETAERDIPLGFAIRLAKYYGVSLDYLAGLK